MSIHEDLLNSEMDMGLELDSKKPEEPQRQIMLGFIISDLKGAKYEGKVSLDRFTDYIIDGKSISIEEIIKVG